MSSLFISVDQGNSRLKLLAWGRGAEGSMQVQQETTLSGAKAASGAKRWAQSLGVELRFGVVSVAGPEALTKLLAELSPLGPVQEPDHGLKNRCASPESVGLDRLFAGRGALEALEQSCVVVDVGTALTVDALQAGQPGEFLGGAIAPGPRLLAHSLATGAAQLPEVQPRPGVPALGGDTQEAIRSGIAIGLRGAARELVQRVGQEAGIPGAPVVLTGGARDFLLEPEPCFEVAPTVLPALVHLGLLHAAGEA